ncbi:hypothetical protein TELCIR_13041 [Teladorsagia circumcincta]|uniref:Uncharacterized protein n=1 Tax=Teladorsagia circumcincta TaxID=45464 RepID=A0A2G9U584_TELCI|nr:hypothetical protein TELCIR_13041 [Teladorsagia circumcincta]
MVTTCSDLEQLLSNQNWTSVQPRSTPIAFVLVGGGEQSHDRTIGKIQCDVYMSVVTQSREVFKFHFESQLEGARRLKVSALKLSNSV